MIILLVSGEGEIRALAQHLRAKGHVVHRAGTGCGALGIGLQQRIDLLICDLELPDMAGQEVIRALSSQSPQLGIVVLASASSANDSAIPYCVVCKPVDIAIIDREIDLVTSSRTSLDVFLIDPDSIHANRVAAALRELGCAVSRFDSVAAALAEGGDRERPTLLLVDAEAEGAVQAIAWAHENSISVIAFAAPGAKIDDQSLIRTGCALVMSKPLDCATILNQARFLSGG